MAVSAKRSDGLLVNSVDKMDIFSWALVSCSVLQLSHTFGFPNHLLNYISRHLHSPVHEPGAFQYTGSHPGRGDGCSLVTEPKYGEVSVEPAIVFHMWRYPVVWKSLSAGVFLSWSEMFYFLNQGFCKIMLLKVPPCYLSHYFSVLSNNSVVVFFQCFCLSSLKTDQCFCCLSLFLAVSCRAFLS